MTKLWKVFSDPFWSCFGHWTFHPFQKIFKIIGLDHVNVPPLVTTTDIRQMTFSRSTGSMIMGGN